MYGAKNGYMARFHGLEFSVQLFLVPCGTIFEVDISWFHKLWTFWEISSTIKKGTSTIEKTTLKKAHKDQHERIVTSQDNQKKIIKWNCVNISKRPDISVIIRSASFARYVLRAESWLHILYKRRSVEGYWKTFRRNRCRFVQNCSYGKIYEGKPGLARVEFS